MEFRFLPKPLEAQRADAFVVGLYQRRNPSGRSGLRQQELTPAAEVIDRITGGWLAETLRTEQFEGKVGEVLKLVTPPQIAAKRLFVVGLGGEQRLSPKNFRKVVSQVAHHLKETPSRSVLLTPIEVEVERFGLDWKLRQTVIAFEEALYRFDRFKSTKSPPVALRQVILPLERQQEHLQAVAEGEAIASGMHLCRDLANQPPNVCTPAYLAEQAKVLAERFPNLTVEVLEEADMETLGMGALLAVGRGSGEPAKLIVLQYRGGQNEQKPIILVGKGITFDAGGISLKPPQNMDEMKFDMCGAASVFGTLQAACELKLPLDLVGVIPSCENLPDGRAYKPGDILKTMSGQTVEVLNTDAEGRLILADALTYSERFQPQYVIDIATLTGACLIALGRHATGLLGNHERLIRALLRAGEESLDRAWQLPLWEEYDEQLESNAADMANVGGREAGTITAACFLARFAKKFRWAHLDIAGTAWRSGQRKGPTGRPVPLLVHFLLAQSRRAARSQQG